MAVAAAVVVAMVMAVNWGFSRRVAVAVAVAMAAWLGYSFLLSWMNERFFRLFLGVNV